MRRLFSAALLLVGCIDATSVGHKDAAADTDALPPSFDLSDVDDATTTRADLSMTDGPQNGPIELTGTFHAGAVEGSANGIVVRGRFDWSAAIAGSANGISVSGSFR